MDGWVITCRIDPSGELNSVAGCDLRAAVHPAEREGRPRGGAGQTDRAAELHQVCVARINLDIGACCLGFKQKTIKG